MVWALAAQAAIQAYQAWDNNMKAQIEASRQNVAKAEAYKRESINAGKASARLRLGDAIATKQYVQDSYSTKREAMLVAQTGIASAAASGTTGASVQAALLDNTRQLNEISAGLTQNYQQQLMNTSLQVYDIYDNLGESVPNFANSGTTKSATIQALATGVTAFASGYAESLIKAKKG